MREMTALTGRSRSAANVSAGILSNFEWPSVMVQRTPTCGFLNARHCDAPPDLRSSYTLLDHLIELAEEPHELVELLEPVEIADRRDSHLAC